MRSDGDNWITDTCGLIGFVRNNGTPIGPVKFQIALNYLPVSPADWAVLCVFTKLRLGKLRL